MPDLINRAMRKTGKEQRSRQRSKKVRISMKKKVSALLIMLMSMGLGGVVCSASIIPPGGPGQIGFSSVVLCDSLSAHRDPDFSSPSVQTLHYGDKIIVMDTVNGWAQAALSDDVDGVPVWVNEDFIAVDPAYYRTEEDTAVYAWADTGAKKVALLDPGTTLPILRDDGDWIIVSLRGAAGWINNPVRTGSSAPEAPRSDSGDNGSSGSSQGSVITVYDEFGEAYTLYEGTDGYWRDRSGTAYDRLSDTEFQVHEGTKRLSANYPSQSDYSGESSEESYNTVFPVYARDGSTAILHPAGGAMYEDDAGRTYVKDDQDGYYYCITTDVTYAFDPTVWTGEAYGENEFPDED